MSEVVVVAEIKTDPERRDEVLAALERLCEATHANDEGCILYSLQFDPADDGRFFMIEKWSSAEALQKHGGTDHIRRVRSRDRPDPPARLAQRRSSAPSRVASRTEASISTLRIETLSTLSPNGTLNRRQNAIRSTAVATACS